MKVEKCPQCDAKPFAFLFQDLDDEHDVFGITHKCAPNMFYRTEKGAYRKFNCWARREAKRIAHEGRSK